MKQNFRGNWWSKENVPVGSIKQRYVPVQQGRPQKRPVRQLPIFDHLLDQSGLKSVPLQRVTQIDYKFALVGLCVRPYRFQFRSQKQGNLAMGRLQSPCIIGGLDRHYFHTGK